LEGAKILTKSPVKIADSDVAAKRKMWLAAAAAGGGGGGGGAGI
jgi:hypothetical protein